MVSCPGPESRTANTRAPCVNVLHSRRPGDPRPPKGCSVSRSRRRRGLVAALAALLAALPAVALTAPAAHASAPGPTPAAVTHHQAADSGRAVHHDTSPPLRTLHATAVSAKKHKADDKEERLPHPPASKIP